MSRTTKLQILVWTAALAVLYATPTSMKLTVLMVFIVQRLVIVWSVRERMAEIMEERHQEQVMLEYFDGAWQVWLKWQRYTRASRTKQVLDLTRWNFHDFYPELGVFK